MSTESLPVGQRVRHLNQQWATGDIWTGWITEVKGPFSDGTFEYEVLTGREFACQLSDDNPMDRVTWWSSRCTIPVQYKEESEQTEG